MKRKEGVAHTKNWSSEKGYSPKLLGYFSANFFVEVITNGYD